MRFLSGDFINNISFPVPQYLQKRLIDYALKKCLSPFVQTDLNSQDLDIQLREGRLSLSNVNLRLETINNALAAYGYRTTRGFVERIEVTLTWTGLFSGKLNIFISGFQLELEPTSTVSPDDLTNGKILDPDTLVESIADVAQSFYADELVADVGVGADEAPDSAMLQGVLNSIMSNLSVELMRTEITLNMKSVSSGVSLVCEKLMLTSSPDRGKTLQSGRVEVHLIRLEQGPGLDCSQPNSSFMPSSSRSTSTSSYDDAVLMQSTVFDLAEGRSIYMSAFESRPGQSAIQEEEEDEEAGEDTGSEQKRWLESEMGNSPREPIRECILCCEDGFDLVLCFETASVQMDLSCQKIQVLCGSVQLRYLLSCWQLFSQSLESITSQLKSKPKTNTPVVDISFKVAAICVSVDLERTNSLTNPTSASPDLPFMELGLHHISGSVESIEFSVAIQDLDLRLSGSSVFRPGICSTPDKALTLRSTSEGGWDIVLRPLTLDLNIKEARKNVLALQKFLASAIPDERKSSSAQTRAFVNVQLDCPEVSISLTVEDQSVHLKLRALVLTYKQKDTRDRLNFNFGDLEMGFPGSPFLTIDNANPNIMDLTIGAARSNKKSLEFLDYENLFSTPEGTQKAESNTLQALKEKAKETCTIMFRAFLSQIEVHLDLQKILSICRAVQNCIHIFSESESAQVISDIQDTPTVCVLAESRGLMANVMMPKHDFDIRASKTTLFSARNLKNIHTSSIECLAVSIRSRDTGEAFTDLISQGLHTQLDHNKRIYPMVIVKQRYNISGSRAGSSVIRIACTDMLYDYHPVMSWLESVRLCSDSISSLYSSKQTQGPAASISFETPMYNLSIDLTNVSIGLNPYITRSKGLLYFRNSAVNIEFPGLEVPPVVHVYAGVVDLFLIDDVEGAQNDLGLSKRSCRDPIGMSLMKLGFVLVANLETVEISLHHQHTNRSDNSYRLDVSGAILTLTTCPDSTATLFLLLNLLRLPVSLSEEQKGLLGLDQDGQAPIDLLERTIKSTSLDLQALLQDALQTTEKDDIKYTMRGVHPISSNNISAGSTSRIASTNADPSVGTVQDDLDFVEEHFLSKSLLRRDRGTKKPNEGQECLLTISGKNCFVVWNLHDGYDWNRTRQKISNAVSAAMTQAQRTSLLDNSKYKSDSNAGDDDSESTDSNEIGDLLFNSIYIALPQGADPETLKRSINIELAEADMSDTASQSTATMCQQKPLHKGGATDDLRLGRSKMHKIRIEASGIGIFARIFDAEEGHVVNEAQLRVNDLEIIDNVSTSTWKKFLTYHRAIGPREQGSSMVQLDLRSIKPVAGLAAAEVVLDVEILPIRLHVDQDTLEFITRFFEFRDSNALPPLNPADELFIQKFQIRAIPIQIDYKPKRVDYRSLRCGRTSEFKNFFILEDSSMILKHIILYGTSGINRLMQHLNDIWLADVKSKQIGSVLAGVSSLRSIATIGGSLKDLVMLPISEYQKDGKIVPGIRKGLSTFAKSTGSEAIRLGAKLAAGTQGILQSAENILQNESDLSSRSNRGHAISLYADQPANLRQGISQGLNGIARNLASTRDTIIAIPTDPDQARESAGAARVTARAVPIAVLRPLIGTTEAISKTLLGLRNSLNPDQKKLNEDKYK